MAYSIDAFRRARDPQTAAPAAAAPLEAPHATDDAIGFWNGEAFVSWIDYVWWQVKKNLNSENTWRKTPDSDTINTEPRNRRSQPAKKPAANVDPTSQLAL